MRAILFRLSAIVVLAAASLPNLTAQSPDLFSAMRWRQIGPTRAGRARALAGVPSQPNVFYIGFDNGGVWRSTDYGANWEPLFDREPTGSIGAIGVAPSNPQIIYVGSGAGIIRPDLATGDGMYKSTDGGKTWRHLGLRDSQMIAMIEVDPTNPNRLFVAALGHPYGQSPERGIFRSTDGGETFQKVLYKDEYTSANDVRLDPNDPNVVYAALWQQQQSYIDGGAYPTPSAPTGGIFKSVDGGTTWKQLTNGLPVVSQANLAVGTSNSNVIYATVAAAPTGAGGGGRGGAGGAGVSLYRSIDGGEHWLLATADPGAPPGTVARAQDNRPMARIGGGDLPTIVVDPNNSNVVYSASTVFWRTEDAGVTWTAVRGAPGGDDYQKAWVNPTNSNILLVVSDQGGVVSGNRGASWSSWYNQPTAAMYHVSTDFNFPYRVCSGQQDSGSACVDSRSNDGEITFHDWHPVNIQEYGEAAPDPRDADKVFGSARGGVSLYDRITGQTSQVGPDITGFTRSVRTMPIEWSPVDHKTLFYALNAVWKSTDGAKSWTRISGDLARQTWDVPANAGKYASTVTPSPVGTTTALSPSPRDIKILWAGTDDGYIQVTWDGGAKWTNVTPPQIKAWQRIFNIEAGHFDSQTAYAAANSMKLDDMNPHLWRTHDGGKSWTEINTGLPAGAVTNSIREDPRKKGLLYAATDNQVWVSFDDGDHWQSLRLNMPAISVRDIELKDDSTCMCADLIAGTHGRGFWILDDVTPLRQVAEAGAASQAYLFKPAPAVRTRWATNDPTPWPPEMPAGENPPPGAIVDYYLAANAAGPVKIEILLGNKVVRTYSSEDPIRNPDPAADPVAYNKLCQATPSLPDCGLPLYWPAPQIVISTQKGMHRVLWDMHYDPAAEGGGRGGGGSLGAVPHRTYASVSSPWAAPGAYTVRLTVGGTSYMQPITLHWDPRIKTPAVSLAQLTSLTNEMYNGARDARASYNDARALSAKLDAKQSAEATTLKAKIDSIAPAAPAGGGGRGGRGGGGGRGGAAATTAAPTLESVSVAMNAAAMAMQGADTAPTANEIAACAKARTAAAELMVKWKALKSRAAVVLK